MPVRGVRGATTCQPDADSVQSATRELLSALLQANAGMQPADIASALFSVTSDLQIVHPARAAREMGWTEVPLMCAREIDVPDGLAHCIRVLLHWNTDVQQCAIKHVYLREAASLRPDLHHEC